jgi:hypothetical protein
MEKTIKDALIISLADFKDGATAKEIYQNILDNDYFRFNPDAKTPYATVQALLGDMIRNEDSRLRREKVDKFFVYYLTQNSKNFSAKHAETIEALDATSYNERDLHPLLDTFLKDHGIYARTIYHEASKKGSEEHAKWVHPDIVGARFVEYDSPECQSFFKDTNSSDSVLLYSYEIKKEIHNDYDLKKNFFQAVSNSSWANYGFLVAFDISQDLINELERLNNSFGIGFILLNSNPYESKVLCPAKKKELDFQTIDKLCTLNPNFRKVIEQIEKIITADDKHIQDSKDKFEEICDNVFTTDAEWMEHCKKKHIPIDKEIGE